MAATQRAKASDKQGVARKLVTTLRKRYKGSPPKDDRPVLETLLYAICLENVCYDEAQAGYDRLHQSFHDLNEIRVSSISELSAALAPLPDPDVRAWRIRTTLHFVFEKNFAFEYESLRKKTLDLAVKQLAKINELSYFNRAYALQAALGSHIVPIDDAMLRACVWLGLADRGATPEQVSEALKPVVRKPDAPQFCYLIRSLATDPEFQRLFESVPTTPVEADGDAEYELATAPARLSGLLEKKAGAKSASSNGAGAKKSSRGGRSKSAGGKSAASAKKKSASKTASRSAARTTKRRASTG